MNADIVLEMWIALMLLAGVHVVIWASVFAALYELKRQLGGGKNDP